MSERFQIWEGVFENFSEVKTEEDVHDGDKWKEVLSKRVNEHIKEYKQNVFCNNLTLSKEYPLYPFLSALNKKEIKILDFGGGLGIDFFKISSSVLNKEIKYHVIETDMVVATAKDILKEFTNIKFSSSIPDEESVDVCHIASTLHYIENWKEVLQKLCNLNPEYISICDLTAGSFPTFVSSQNYYNKKIPMLFFNLNEVLSFFQEQGFELIFKSLYEAKICGEYGKLPVEKLPKTHQLDYTCNLIFKKV